MAEFTVNADRFDPYKQFKFRVKWDGRYVPGVSRVTGLTRRTEVVGHRDGADPSAARRSPGRTAYAPIVLERGRTHDDAFERWSDKVWRLGAGLGSEVSLKDFRKDVSVELYNEAGQLAIAFLVYRCWPSSYTALGDLEANATRVAVESLTLEHEGWERDAAVTEPEERAV